MKIVKIAGHCFLSLVLAGAVVGVPAAVYLDVFGQGDEADAVSSASLKPVGQPSGVFYVLINETLHEDSLEDWKQFFRNDEDFPVIFDDIRCITAQGDENSTKLADRYRVQLPENQMHTRTENPVLLVSKIEQRQFDMAIISKELAEQLLLKDNIPHVTVVEITGGDSDEKA